MTVVDGHVHVGLTKYVPAEVLLAQMGVAGIDKALLVQYGGCHDNVYLKQCMDRFPGRFASLGGVDYAADDVADRIRREVTENNLAGLRIPAATQNEAVWETVGELGIMASLSGGIDGMIDPRIEGYIKRFPDARFRIEHMGWFPDVERSPDYAEYERLLSYSAYPNVVFMVSGFYAFGKAYPYTEAVPFIERVLEAYGPRRMIWGSDFPPVAGKETVSMTLEMVRAWGCFSESDLEWVLGKSAMAILNF
jgi:L-fuconolactonase